MHEIPRPAYPVVNDPARPVWHFGPPAYWMNDPNGVIWHDGWCHVFYQHNPGGDGWADMHWGHARSRDLVHWEHLPIALRPQLADGELHCYSGCLALTARGEPRILYTTVPSHDDPAARNAQALATPGDADWRTWTQHVTPPFLDLATHGGPPLRRDWRDPFVFRTEGRTFMILGAILADETVIPLYENPSGDLEHWIYRGIIHREPRATTLFLECPNLIRYGEKWLLLTSPCRPVDWLSGTLDLENYLFHVERRGRVDESDHYYATHPAIDPSGRVVLFAWVKNFPKGLGWNGCLGVPRRLWLDARGDCCSAPVAEIEQLRDVATDYAPQTLAAAPLDLPLPAGGQCDAELLIERSASATIIFQLAGLNVVIETYGVHFDGRPLVPLAPADSPVRIRWLLDRSVLELFINDRATYTRVVPYPVEPVARLFRTEGSARLVSGRVWTMRAAPTSAV